MYPRLEDHDRVTKYQSVRGMDKNVFFLTHGNKELGGGDDSVSKHNPYEVCSTQFFTESRLTYLKVSMVKDLVKYLLR